MLLVDSDRDKSIRFATGDTQGDSSPDYLPRTPFHNFQGIEKNVECRKSKKVAIWGVNCRNWGQSFFKEAKSAGEDAGVESWKLSDAQGRQRFRAGSFLWRGASTSKIDR